MNGNGGGCLHENCPVWINPKQKIIASKLKPNMTIIDSEGNETFIKIVTRKKCIDGTAPMTIICEDVWHNSLIEKLNLAGVNCILTLNGSPFNLNKNQRRITKLSSKSKKYKMNIIYVNLVGAQDELVFDGGSLAFNTNGTLCANGASFKEDIAYADMDLNAAMLLPNKSLNNYPTAINQIITVITRGIHDYVQKNNFM